MFLKGKIITFIIPVFPWSREDRNQVWEEIIKLREWGAEVFPLLFIMEEDYSPLVREIKKGIKGLVVGKGEGLSSSFFYQGDLLLIAPCPGPLLREMARGNLSQNLPLILAPHSYGKESKEALASLRSLFKRDLTYFVPFQPLGKKDKEGKACPFFRSRLDLIGETTGRAAREGQVQPVVLELETLPGE